MARIAVMGSVGLDEVVQLAAPLRANTHLESLGRTLRIGGGGANVALPLAAAGHAVNLVGAVGRDPLGEQLVEELRAGGVDTSTVVRLEGESTRSIVLVDPSGERTVINLHRCADSAPAERLRELEVDLVYVRSRLPGLGPLLASLSARVVAHVPPTEPSSRPAAILVGSQSDLLLDDPAAFWALARRVAGPRLEWAVLTRGAQGAVAQDGQASFPAPAPPVAAVDTTGAGDAFAAGLLHALAGGAAMAAAVSAGVRWGSTAVTCRASALPPGTVRQLVGSAPLRLARTE